MAEAAEKRQSWVVSFVILAVVINFVYDWVRRGDFEEQRRGLETLVGDLRDRSLAEFDAVSVLAADGRQQLEVVQDLLMEVDSSISMTKDDNEADSTPAFDESINKSSSAPEIVSDDSIFELSTDELQFRMDSLTSGPLVAELLSQIRDPKEWDPEVIIDAFEDASRYVLSEDERAAVKNRIESKKLLAHSAYARFKADKADWVADRLLAGDFFVAGPDGRFMSSRNTDLREKTFSVDVRRNRMFDWRKEDYPELYRKWMVYEYIPVEMLAGVQRFFEERTNP